MTVPCPYALLAEITYQCPLHCPYCSNPVAASLPAAPKLHKGGCEAPRRPPGDGYSNGELTTEEWKRVIREAAALGVLQIGFSGGEPLARRDLVELIRAAREENLYTNLITSGIVLDDDRLRWLRDARLDSIQLSFQSDESSLADEIAGARAHERKLDVAAKIREARIPLSLNFVIHRRSIDRLNVNAIGDVLPCPTASSAIPHLRFENIRTRDLGWIWRESESFNRFRGTEWMPEPCRSCPQKEIDFGGCRCQAALLTGKAANTDPVCEFSPNRGSVDAAVCEVNSSRHKIGDWTYRQNPEQVLVST